jgi:hypothetical protein
MIRKNTIIGFVLFSLFLTNQSVGQEIEKARDMLKQRGEIYIKINPDRIIDLKEASDFMSIDGINHSANGKELFAYLNPGQFDIFSAKGIEFELLTPPSLKQSVSMCTNLNEVRNWNCYPTYEQYLELMQSFETNFPELCKLSEFGKSIDGRKLLVVKISDQVQAKEEEPEFFYTSTMHGDETTGYILMLRLIDYLLNNYQTDTRVKNLVNNTEIWINPLSNPDGTYYAGNSTVNGARRSNLYGIDLNRNFPNLPSGSSPTIQKENQEMIKFLKEHNFVLAANFHGGAEVVNYPWDNWTSSERLHADDKWYQAISKEYADTVHANSSNYMVRLDGLPNPSGITNGGDWYTISGSRQDYMNYFIRSREVTIEISNTKMPDPALLPAYWNYNYRSLLNYIARVHQGVSGKITDAQGKPVKALFKIEGHDSFNSEIFSDSTTGMYYRLLPAGNYQFTVFVKGSEVHRFNAIVPINSRISQDITLNVDKVSLINQITNPFSNNLLIYIELPQNKPIEISLFDYTGKVVLNQIRPGNYGSNRIDIPTHTIKPGSYICHIRSGKLISTHKLFKYN